MDVSRLFRFAARWLSRGDAIRPRSAAVPLCAPFHIGRIFDRLRQLDIPRVMIVVGRDPDETHLLRAVKQARDLGLIVGVRGRGSDLGLHTRIAEMAAAGLDRLDVYCLSVLDEVHNALAGAGDCKMAVRALGMARKSNVRAVAQIALVRPTLTTIDRTLEAVAAHGIDDVCAFAVATTEAAWASAGALLADELAPTARQVEESAKRLGMRLAWSPTVRFDPNSPLGEQVCRGPRSGGDKAIRVEPDGSVIPARGPYRPVGNLLEDDWKTILAIFAADYSRESARWAEPEDSERRSSWSAGVPPA